MTIEEHLEKTQISDLLKRYFSAIDDKNFAPEIIEAVFTERARIIRPDGSETTGRDEILASNIKSFARFKATYHVTTDLLIDIAADTASIRANLTGMHLWANDENNPALNNKHFQAGNVLTAKAIKTGNKWRISELTYRNVWRTGEGLAEMARFQSPKN